MKKAALLPKFYNIMTSEGSDEATIFLYGYIGTWYEWDSEEGYKDVGLKDMEFIKEFEALTSKYKKVHLRINSPGGEVFHGSAMVTAIRNCTNCEVHTWLDGVAASMSGVIWLAGHKRHAAKNGMLMLHNASNFEWGNAKHMRNMADTLDKFDESLIIACADAVGMDEKEMREKCFDYTDKWFSFNDLKAEGWLTEEDAYQSADPVPTNLTKMPYRDLVAFYQAKQQPAATRASDDADGGGIITSLKKIFEDAKNDIREILNPSSSNDDSDMTIEEFKASLADGTLKLDDVTAHLQSLTPPAPPAAPPAGPTNADDPAALRATITAMEEKFTALEARLTALGAQPGAGKSTPTLPENDPAQPAGGSPTAAQILEAENQRMLAAAQSGEAVMFAPAVK